MYARSRPELPNAGVRFVIEVEGALAENFQSEKFGGAGLHEQARIEEYRRNPENEIAIGIVLKMLVGLVADTHRPHAAVAIEVVDRAFDQLPLERNAVYRLNVAGQGIIDDVHDPAKIPLHGPDGSQAVERPHDEEGVAYPAISVVPVAGAVRRLRN